MIKSPKLFTSIIFLLFSANLFAQITVKAIPFNDNVGSDSLLFGETQTRAVEILNSNWNVFSENNSQNKITTTVPADFKGDNSLFYEKEVILHPKEFKDHYIKLGFLGLNYSAEISLNNYNIYKRASGEIPFEVELPEDLLRDTGKNKITITVNSELNSDSSIPVSQRFLFPAKQSGIIRDVYLKFIPKTNISNIVVNSVTDLNPSRANINISLTVQNLYLLKDSVEANKNVILKAILTGKSGSQFKYEVPIKDIDQNSLDSEIKFSISNPELWSPETPNIYRCRIQLLADNKLIDEFIKDITLKKFSVNGSNLTINGKPITLKGTTYYLTENTLTNTSAIDKISSDLNLIKKSGFNAVRFAKSYPHPFALEVCRQIGLIALVELPLNSIPEQMLSESDFINRSVSRLSEMLKEYDKYSDVFAIGLGGGYLSDSETTEQFLSKLAGSVRNKSLFTYASFYGIQSNDISDMNLYGIELFARSTEATRKFLSGLSNEPKYFVSEINYPDYVGSATGYLVKNSTEAQAKYFDNTINIIDNKKLGGFFLNTFYDFQGDYKSLFAAYSNENMYSLGIVNRTNKLNSLTYKTISSKLTHTGNTTIPIGSQREENKLMFIILALGLAVIMAGLINTRKKFREDCSRALFKPYNFFADIRDNRIIPTLHTLILFLIEAGSSSLLFTIILFYLRSNILMEKILLSFGIKSFIDTTSKLAWHPGTCFIVTFIVLTVMFFVITILIKIASLFIKTRVEYAGIFYSSVWALLPFTLLLPAELILYKILAAYSFNIVIVSLLIIFSLWIIQRLLKGVYVIFDINPFTVYVYSITIVVFVAAVIIVYFQLTDSTIYYIANAIKQYQLTSF